MSTLLTLGDFTRPDLIVPALRGPDQAAVLMELARRLHAAGVVEDLMQFYHAAYNREFLESTSVGDELALPHVRMPGLARLVFALGRSSAPIPWTGAPRQAVRWVLLAAVPATNLTEYLGVLSAVARMTGEGDFRAALAQASGAETIFELLQSIPLKSAHSSLQPALA